MKSLVLAVVIIAIATFSFAADGAVTVQSSHDASVTADRLENLLQKKGMTIFNRIDHAAGAKGVGIDLRPTILLVFGNPKVGSPLMQCSQTAAIDLPQKALIWEDGDGKTFVSYNDPAYVKKRHGVKGCEEVLAKITKALANFAKGAAAP